MSSLWVIQRRLHSRDSLDQPSALWLGQPKQSCSAQFSTQSQVSLQLVSSCCSRRALQSCKLHATWATPVWTSHTTEVPQVYLTQVPLSPSLVGIKTLSSYVDTNMYKSSSWTELQPKSFTGTRENPVIFSLRISLWALNLFIDKLKGVFWYQ